MFCQVIFVLFPTQWYHLWKPSSDSARCKVDIGQQQQWGCAHAAPSTRSARAHAAPITLNHGDKQRKDLIILVTKTCLWSNNWHCWCHDRPSLLNVYRLWFRLLLLPQFSPCSGLKWLDFVDRLKNISNNWSNIFMKIFVIKHLILGSWSNFQGWKMMLWCLVGF